jgi:hypothetical protein
MRAWLPTVLAVPFVVTGCPGLLSDWTIGGSSSADASDGVAGPEAGADSSGSGASSGSSGGSSLGASGSAPHSPGGSSGSGGSPGSGASTSGGLGGSLSSGGSVSGTGGSDLISDAGGCVESSCPSCGPVLGPACCTPQGRCGCPTVPFVPSTCGAVDACSPVTHDNGFGSKWEDCVGRGTYNETQAMRACGASGAPECRATNCGVGDLVVCGYSAAQNYVYGCWGYAGEFVGRAKEGSDSCSGFTASWN